MLIGPLMTSGCRYLLYSRAVVFELAEVEVSDFAAGTLWAGEGVVGKFLAVALPLGQGRVFWQLQHSRGFEAS